MKPQATYVFQGIKIGKIGNMRDPYHRHRRRVDLVRGHLNPHPGSAFSRSLNATVVPDVVVEEVDGQFEVRTERGSIPELSISPVYRNLLKREVSGLRLRKGLRRRPIRPEASPGPP